MAIWLVGADLIGLSVDNMSSYCSRKALHIVFSKIHVSIRVDVIIPLWLALFFITSIISLESPLKIVDFVEADYFPSHAFIAVIGRCGHYGRNKDQAIVLFVQPGFKTSRAIKIYSATFSSIQSQIYLGGKVPKSKCFGLVRDVFS